MTFSPAAIINLMNKQCACELTVVRGAGEPLTFSDALIARSPLTPALASFQQDMRGSLFDSSVIHTTLPPLAGDASHVSVSEAEFSALAAANKLVAWSIYEDGFRRGVAVPLATYREVVRRSFLREQLLPQAAEHVVVAVKANNAGLEFALLPGTKSLVIASAPPGAGVAAGMAVRCIGGTRVEDPRQAATLVQQADHYLELAYVFGEVLQAYALPVIITHTPASYKPAAYREKANSAYGESILAGTSVESPCSANGGGIGCVYSLECGI